ncbi:MAG: exodeoxyribonuclease VII large subunit, partial [Clostridia bacterium]|nr:exodeoxyribonuclease VII large subunit [Clostridia bacterium]
KMYVATLEGRMNNAFGRRLDISRSRLDNSAAKLNALDPLSVLKRGYAAVFDENGEVVKSEKQIKNGEAFRLELSDGAMKAVRKD